MTIGKDFDLLHSPLEGTRLIQASAGTGKTFTLCGLYLRLVIEKAIPVDRILVVTFTEAATAELKERIRANLHAAIVAFQAGRAENDFLDSLVRAYEDSREAVRRLREGLQGFDQAAIYTIHGFCRRILQENAFESRSLFDTELVVEDEILKGEIIDDFWRRHFYAASPLFVNYALKRQWGPKGLLSFISNKISHPDLKVIPKSALNDSSCAQRGFTECFDAVSEAWPAVRQEVEHILLHSEGLKRNSYGRERIPAWMEAMDAYAASGGNDPDLFKGFEKFTSSTLKKASKKGYSPPDHPFFRHCETLKQRQAALKECFDTNLLHLKESLFGYMQEELEKRKEEKNIQFFDDLLIKVRRGITQKSGDLSGAVQMRFDAALVDEFQDTDPVQYAIFKSFFGRQNHILFLIGDPKQAIYSFRGADIFAYIRAADDIAWKETLKENWRSSPGLIEAVNALFSNVENPFLYQDIPFEPARPAQRRCHALLRLGKEAPPPFTLWYIDSDKHTGGTRPLSKRAAREMISRAVAAEISRLLLMGRKSRALIGDRPLVEEDIAVLVRTNAEARLMQQALSELRVPTVLFNAGHLFDSREALEVARVLAAMASPHKEGLVRAALATDLIGIQGEDLDRAVSEGSDWEDWLIRFRSYHDLWHDRGFIQMFRPFLFRENVLSRLMKFQDGERRNTNLMHLAEILHRVSVERNFESSGLLKWLVEQIVTPAQGEEDHLLRLESDEAAVRLVTVHKSKGLEFPVVFCPFMWGGSKSQSKEDVLFHDESDEWRLTLDLGSADRDRHRTLADQETLAENLRLLYVALTRAQSRCYLVWGRIKDAETSALAYLFHGSGAGEGKEIVSHTANAFRELESERIVEDLEKATATAGGAASVSEMPREPGQILARLEPLKTASYRFRSFSGVPNRAWRVTSFSSLTSGRSFADEAMDRDGMALEDRKGAIDPEETLENKESLDIFSFPRGTRAGTFLHEVFECLDFVQESEAAVRGLVAAKLKQYGFESLWLDTICRMIRHVLETALDPVSSDLRLSRIRREDRLNEMEFYFPLKRISPEILAEIFQIRPSSKALHRFPEFVGQLQFAPAKGFMRGFIDLVFQWQGRFYLVDWKSNFLGTTMEDYSLNALSRVMTREYYTLQYHLYLLALDQYLRSRMPEYRYKEHFGGVFYVFLRGVRPEAGPDFGIYRDRPLEETMESLREGLIEPNRA
ncbi:MAG: exodeoxyribonuclease V subunit beta [Thermodesulfobacteriota bacterium]|nr:exodeoxyribonuclease V subunit beta [Thermodesulfobacteriota bacterium]